MITILIRTFIIYTVVLISVRLMGKTELSSMDPFQIVILFMIGELAALPIESLDTSMIYGVVAILAILFLEAFTSALSLKSEIFKTLINGRPSVLIENGILRDKELRKATMSIADLMEQLRIKGYPSIADVSYAVLETNGEISIVPKAEKKNITCEDMCISKEKEYMPAILISDGKWYKQNLKNLGIQEQVVRNTMLSQGITNEKQVFLCFSDETRNLHFFPKSNTGANWR